MSKRTCIALLAAVLAGCGDDPAEPAASSVSQAASVAMAPANRSAASPGRHAPPGFASTDDSLQRLSELLARVKPPDIAPGDLLGKWRAAVADIDPGQGLPAPDVGAFPPIDLVFADAAGSITLSAAGGGSERRVLRFDGDMALAQGDGASDIRITRRGTQLVLELETTGAGKVVLHATRVD